MWRAIPCQPTAFLVALLAYLPRPTNRRRNHPSCDRRRQAVGDRSTIGKETSARQCRRLGERSADRLNCQQHRKLHTAICTNRTHQQRKINTPTTPPPQPPTPETTQTAVAISPRRYNPQPNPAIPKTQSDEPNKDRKRPRSKTHPKRTTEESPDNSKPAPHRPATPQTTRGQRNQAPGQLPRQTTSQSTPESQPNTTELKREQRSPAD
jgi:hypothetical protein